MEDEKVWLPARIFCRCIHFLSPALIHLVDWSKYQSFNIVTLANSLYYHREA